MPSRSRPVHVSIATIPSRIGELRPTIDSLLRGTRVPEKIFVVHPAYCEWEKSGYDVPEFFSDYDWHGGIVEHVVCDKDWGPTTKIMGVVERLPQESYLVIADDDVLYDRNFLAGLMDAQRNDDCSSFSYFTYRSDGLTIATGCDGVTFYTPNLANVDDFVRRHVEGTSLLFHDDLWIAFYLYKHNVRVRKVPLPGGGDELIYTQVLPNTVLSGPVEGRLSRENIYKEGLERLFREGGLDLSQRVRLRVRGYADWMVAKARSAARRLS